MKIVHCSAEPSALHIELLYMCRRGCMFKTNNSHCVQAKAFNGGRRQYCWNRIHSFGIKCLKLPLTKQNSQTGTK